MDDYDRTPSEGAVGLCSGAATRRTRATAVRTPVFRLCGSAGFPDGLFGHHSLLALKRGHWAIENSLHRVKDMALGEDASMIHCGQGLTVMALLRDAAVSLLRRAGVRQISARLRYHSQQPAAAGALLLAAPPPDA